MQHIPYSRKAFLFYFGCAVVHNSAFYFGTYLLKSQSRFLPMVVHLNRFIALGQIHRLERFVHF